jgi:two-component system, NarL family, response regulator LiaR
MTIKILLVDDHAVVRSGLSKFLLVNKDMKLVGEASDGEEAVQKTSLYRPDVVLMDLMMPGKDGITATREIHQKYPNVKVIALTSFAEQNIVQGALQAVPLLTCKKMSLRKSWRAQFIWLVRGG